MRSKDPKKGLEIVLAPPPYRTEFLEETGGLLNLPPRFDEHNELYYSRYIGLSESDLASLRQEGVI